jgi:hypothetical protein
MSETLKSKIMAQAEFVALDDQCDGCGLGITLVERNPHLPLIASLATELEHMRDALHRHLESGPYGEWSLLEPDQDGHELKQALARLELFEKGLSK